MTPSPADIARVLRAAADRIEPEGAWCQGEYAKKDARLKHLPPAEREIAWCGFGAVAVEALRIRDDPILYRDSEIAMSVALGGHFIRWNDAPSRTQAEVVAKLREIAAELEGQANA